MWPIILKKNKLELQYVDNMCWVHKNSLVWLAPRMMQTILKSILDYLFWKIESAFTKLILFIHSTCAFDYKYRNGNRSKSLKLLQNRISRIKIGFVLSSGHHVHMSTSERIIFKRIVSESVALYCVITFLIKHPSFNATTHINTQTTYKFQAYR